VACWLVGYCEYFKGWRLWDSNTRKIFISRDVTFDETILIDDTPNAPEKEFNPCEPFQIVMDILKLNPNVQNEENQIQVALDEKEVVKQTPK
jgi:hypothetical protein